MTNNLTGKFLVSLDFELLWGVHDHETKESFKENILGAREGIKKMLSLFNKYSIHVTWGTVGLLMAENYDDVSKYSPKIKPEIQKQNLSAYTYMHTLGKNEEDDFCHYANSLVSDILKHPNQEIASHTFSHYYCKENGQTLDSFEADLLSAQKIAQDKFGIQLKSLILPRNQFNNDYVEKAYSCGFSAVRGNHPHYAYNNNTLFARMIRLLDTYISICGSKSYKVQYSHGKILDLKASVFYRRYNTKLFLLEPLKIACIKRQMKKAAKNGEVFHLWWHPHNIGKNTDKCLQQLENLFMYYTKLNSTFGFESKNMKELSEEIIYENNNVMP